MTSPLQTALAIVLDMEAGDSHVRRQGLRLRRAIEALAAAAAPADSAIAVPTYLLDDPQLLELWERLHGFASGDPDFSDAPCARAQRAQDQIRQELTRRGRAVTLRADGTIAW